MDISKVKVKGTWRDVADVARTTIGKEEGEGSVSDSWKKRILLAEHSPIRLLWFRWKWKGIKYWVSVHLVRHWLGIVHFVKSSRSDRTGVPRDELPQNHAVNHECDANAQALINISRRRICKQACIYVVCVLCRLVLKLCHSRKLTELCVAVEHPCHFCVCMHMALNEEKALFCINSASKN